MKSLLFCASLVVLFSSCIREPEACFSLDRTTYAIDEAVKFNQCSKFGERYEWDFGDGQRSEERSPIHKYQNTGHYTAVLRVFNNKGEEDYAVSVDVGTYFIKTVDVLTVEDTITGPRFVSCDKLYLTNNLSDFAFGYGQTCWTNLTIKNGQNVGQAQSLPAYLNLGFIHYYYVLKDTDNWDDVTVVYDTLYMDSTVEVNLHKRKLYENMRFYGRTESALANLEFGFEVRD